MHSDYEPDWIDVFLGEDDHYDDGRQSFELFWTEVNDYAKELNLPLSYVEEEFVIDGQLIKDR